MHLLKRHRSAWQPYDRSMGNQGGTIMRRQRPVPNPFPPTQRMLQHWRQLLRSCFLLANNQLDNPLPPPIPLLQTPHPTTFSQHLLTNEHELSIMGPGVLGTDNIAEILADRLHSGLTIVAFGDGTVKYGIGAHGRHIRPHLNLSHDQFLIQSASQIEKSPGYHLFPPHGKCCSSGYSLFPPINLYLFQ